MFFSETGPPHRIFDWHAFVQCKKDECQGAFKALANFICKKMQRHAYLLPLQLLAINVSAVAAASIYLRKSDNVSRRVYGPVLIVANLLNCVNAIAFSP